MKKQFVATLALLLLLTFATYAQKGTKQATARIIESTGPSLISLTYEDGKSEIIPLQKLRLMGNSTTTIVENQQLINKMLNTMSEKGYEVTQMSVSGENFLYTFIVFSKKE